MSIVLLINVPFISWLHIDNMAYTGSRSGGALVDIAIGLGIGGDGGDTTSVNLDYAVEISRLLRWVYSLSQTESPRTLDTFLHIHFVRAS
ncbi:hypothetical protein MNBD_GAMMA24-485 [hydrothermal vent metagenome]|uniref:Uncharacterized protein n=1 Tax=hydrothermal vent metagenome TaxID=652676 RepID=A0A3B1C5Y6_9ZZZZ